MCAHHTVDPSWRVAAVLIALLAAPGGLLYLVIRPAMPPDKIRQLRVGMTEVDVRRILGSPARLGGHLWEYSRWGNAGYVQVTFDANGAVQMINDESVFPPKQ